MNITVILAVVVSASVIATLWPMIRRRPQHAGAGEGTLTVATLARRATARHHLRRVDDEPDDGAAERTLTWAPEESEPVAVPIDPADWTPSRIRPYVRHHNWVDGRFFDMVGAPTAQLPRLDEHTDLPALVMADWFPTGLPVPILSTGCQPVASG
ncbi:hypothetical protein LX15_001770 [Streptoalloteichus tenebrarius]|uniref:Secreted protein n=1 Tax=Streptoalloteichus tenebrarius (strain ATCC 17920 / DSM 40477 / JCM 4838 / CBS 697.72 / NBRC 16177 / NCIMB 11028 / NRRL B-12390 / A12253. 1 / ISP 5477) TaxID=1933 RepID=A0ABT1HRH7_STRSD|nr:hypothetical protein [Streptoalloteichus tenebrarius]MCP2258083.1 hypothetical protein [Streptoalloteichus tenebrarius]BFF01756.1 hypothetical protein GCM10020241_34310 [Streptoalloteichus tenebrarius]